MVCHSRIAAPMPTEKMLTRLGPQCPQLLLLLFLLNFSFDQCLINSHHHATPNFFKYLKLSPYLSLYLSFYLSLYVYITLSMYQAIYLSLYLSMSLSIYQTYFYLSIYQSILYHRRPRSWYLSCWIFHLVYTLSFPTNAYLPMPT